MTKMIITDAIQHCFSSLLEVHFDNAEKHFIAFEILRIYSPKASTKSTGQFLSPLVVDKAFVKIKALDFDDNAMLISFDDNHTSEDYSATYLKHLCEQQDTLWRDYLARVRYAKQLKDNAIRLVISD